MMTPWPVQRMYTAALYYTACNLEGGHMEHGYKLVGQLKILLYIRLRI